MTQRKAKAAAADEEAAAARPPAFYVASRDLYQGGGDTDMMPVLAYRAGDRVQPDVFDGNPLWQQFLAAPDDEAEAASAADATTNQAPDEDGANQDAGSGQGEEQ